MKTRTLLQTTPVHAPSILHATSILPTALSAVVLVLAISSTSRIAAQPVTLRFDATLSSIEGDLSLLDLPFGIGIGQTITGEIVANDSELIENVLGLGDGPIASSTIGLRLWIEGIEINNSFNIGSLNQPPVDINNPTTDPKSAITFAWVPLGNVVPGWAGFGLDVPWDASIVLIGQDGLIPGPEAALDFSAWNQLDESRVLSMAFGFPDTVSVTAQVGDIVVVPEPASLVTALCLVSLILTGRAMM